MLSRNYLSPYGKHEGEGESAEEGTLARTFSESVRVAVEKAILRNVLLIAKHAEKNVQAAQWFLSRRRPEEWAEPSKPETRPPISDQIQTPRITGEQAIRGLHEVLKKYPHLADE